MFFKRVFVFPFLKISLSERKNQVELHTSQFNLVASCFNAAFYLSHDIRRDTLVFLLFKAKNIGNLCLKFVGKDLKRFYPDEYSISGLVRNSIIKFKNHVKIHEKVDEEFQASPGIFVFKNSLSELVSKLNNAGYQILYPLRKGTDVRNIRFSQKIAYIVDSESLTDELSRKILHTRGTGIHFGNTLPRIDIQIILLHNELDRLETNCLSNSL